MNKLKTNIRINLKIYLIILSFILNACNIFNSNKHLTGPYYLKNDEFGKALCYRVNDDGDCIELVNGAFGRIGLDDNYIIIERDQYDYLIVPVYKKFTAFPEKGILGPFNLNEFNRQKQKLHIKAKL